MCFLNFTVRFSSIAKLTVMDADYAISFHRGSVVGNFSTGFRHIFVSYLLHFQCLYSTHMT